MRVRLVLRDLCARYHNSCAETSNFQANFRIQIQKSDERSNITQFENKE